MTDDATPREVGSHAGLGLEPERCVSPSVIADVMLGSPGMRRAVETLRAADQAALLLSGRAVWDAAVAEERERCAKLIEPKNPPSDWTPLAQYAADLARRIRTEA